MNIKLFSESSEHIWVNQELHITVLIILVIIKPNLHFKLYVIQTEIHNLF